MNLKSFLKRGRKSRLIVFVAIIAIILPLVINTLLNVTSNRVLADSLIGFNEGYGTTVSDSSGSASGTITNAVWKAEEFCFEGKCLYFDGSGDYVSFGDDSDYDFAASANFTIEFRFRTGDITSGTRVFVSKYRGDDAEGGYKVYMNSDGKVVFGVDDDNSFGPDDSATSINAYDDNRWHHVTAVKTGTTSLALYIDAIKVAEDLAISATGTLVNDDSFLLGIDYAGNAFTGFLDELKVYTTTARNEDEIKTDALGVTAGQGTAVSFGPDNSNLSDGLVGYWKMDDAGADSEGEISTDSSGNGNNGTLYGDNSIDDNGTGMDCTASGKFGTGCSFDGTDDYIQNLVSNFQASDEQGTITAWVKPDNFDDSQAIFGSGDNGSTNRLLDVHLSSAYAGRVYIVQQNLGTSNVVLSDDALVSGQWNFLVAISTGTEYKIYVNGVESSLTTTSGVNNGNWFADTQYRDNITIGALEFNNVKTYLFDGTIDNVRIYNRVLSPVEIQNLYNWAPGPMGYWKLDEGQGLTAYDSSGNNVTGTLDSAVDVLWKTGKFGNGLTTNAGSNHGQIVLNYSASVKGLSAFTTTAWVYPTSSGTSGRGRYFYAENCSDNGSYGRNVFGAINNYAGCGAGVFGSFMRSAEDYSVVLCDPNTYTINRWYHVAAVFNSETDLHKLYVNGVLVDTDTYNSPAIDPNNPASYPVMGNHPYSTGYNFPGIFDEVKLYNYERTQGQIVEDMNAGHPAPGSPVGSAVGEWSFEEGYGDTVHNTGNGGTTLNGDLAGSGTTCPTTGACPTWTNSGKFGKALSFDGTDDYINVPYSTSLNVSDVTLSVWVYPTAIELQNLIRYETESGGVRYTLGLAASGRIQAGFGPSGGTIYPTTPASIYATSNWYHIVSTYNSTSGEGKIYVNGKLYETVTSSGPLNSGNQALTIGYSGTTSWLHGSVDDFRLYNSALTEDQIKLLYNQGQSAVFGALGTASDGSPSNSSTDSYCPPGQSTTCVGPVAEWKFDENTGTSVNDISGNNLTGTFAGSSTPFWTIGKYGSAGVFNGINNRVSVNDSDLLSFGNGTTDQAFTISTWLYTNAIENSYILAKISEYFLSLNTSGYLTFFAYDNSASAFIGRRYLSAFPTNEWHHVEAVYDGSGANTGFKIYLDGRQVDDGNYSNNTYVAMENTSNVFIVGEYTESFNGKIDNLRIYNYARTPAQIAWDYNRGGPVGWWKLDENQTGDGQTIYDSSGNGYNGITEGGTGNLNCTSTGKRNTACDFDGSDDYVSFSNGPDISGSEGSISFWMNINDNLDQDNQQYVYTGTSDSYSFQKIFGANTWGFHVNNYELYSETDFFQENQWYHVMLTWNETDRDRFMYINGNLHSSNTTTYFDTPSSVLTYLSRRSVDNSKNFNGQIDDVKIWNYALTEEQIQLEYNQGAVRFGP